MAISERTVLAGTMAAALWLGPAQPAVAQEARLAMRIVVYDYAHACRPICSHRRGRRSRPGSLPRSASKRRGLDVAEFTREMPIESAARRVFVASVVQVNVISPDMHKRRWAARTASSGESDRVHALARWIAFARIQQLARLSRADVSDVLGSVMAHEIGHVFLPPGAHALTGRHQHSFEPNLIAQNRVFFLSEEATLIRATLAGHAAR